VPREDFIPADHRAAAYTDRAIPLGGGRFATPPLYTGKALAAAEPTKADKALVVSAGSLYLAEVLRPLVGSLEVVDAADIAKNPPKGPYSLIIIDGAAGEVPQALADALASDGRIVTGLFNKSVTRLALGMKNGSALAFTTLGELGIPAYRNLPRPNTGASKRENMGVVARRFAGMDGCGLRSCILARPGG
jgi:protein-L-isoaspartate(D-aspartate) O-methyltransferase